MKSISKFHQMLILDALFEGGRMFVGATSITYLLYSGLSLSQIAILKSVQAITILLGEVPTGVLADTLGRKKSLLTASLCAILGFALYFSSETFHFFILAEILTGLSLCFWSGAFEALSIDEAQLQDTAGKMDHFFHLNQSINSSVVLIFGFLGGLLGHVGLSFPYLAAIAAYLLMATILWSLEEQASNALLINTSPSVGLSPFQKHLKAILSQGLLQPALAPFFLTNILIQFSIQPLLHYWQPYFQSLNPQIGTEKQGLIFAAYCGTSAVFGWLYAKHSKKQFFRSAKMTLLLFCAFSFLYALLGRQNPWIIAAVTFCLLQGVLAIARTSLSVRMNENIEASSRASILSSLSLVSRLGMVTALFAIGQILPTGSMPNTQAMISLFNFFGLGSIALTLLILVGIFLNRKKKGIV